MLNIYCHDCSSLGGANIQMILFALSCYETLNYETQEIKKGEKHQLGYFDFYKHSS